MSRLNKKLSIWEEHSLISPEQRRNILDFENSNKKPAVLIGLSFVGIFVVILGIISIIASNWDNIPPSLKLIGNYSLFAAIIFVAYHSYHKGREKICEASILALFMMIGATIGLTAQIYNLSGEFYSACFYWSILAIPLLIVTKMRLLPLLWVPMFYFSSICTLDLFRIIEDIIKYIRFMCAWEAILSVIGIVIFAVFAIIFQILNKKFGKKITVFGVAYFYAILSMYISAFSGVFTSSDSIYSFIPCVIVLLSFLGYMTYVSYIKGRSKHMNMNLTFMAIGFFIVYLRLADDMLSTGLGLVISGFFIIMLVYVFSKFMIKTHHEINSRDKEENQEVQI